jgi:uncharacterized protein with FMN-binding domain
MTDQNRTKIIGLMVIVLLTVIGTAGAVAYNNRPLASQQSMASNTSLGTSSTSLNAGTQSAGTTPTSNTTPTSPSSTYKDGTYTSNGSFYTPNGSEQIGVTITLASNKITNVSIDSSSISSNTSYEYTSLFKDGINQAVDGQNIKDVQVGRISGASLTPIGFNSALEIIKNEAQA